MKIDTFSFPGSTACNLNVLTNIGDGGLFAIQSQNNMLLSAVYRAPAVLGYGSILDYDQQLKYLSSTMQIYHPASGLCLDDGGNEVLGPSVVSTPLSFTSCDSSSINQQFIFTTGKQIYNPNWPNNQICLNWAGNQFPDSSSDPYYQELILWYCEPSNWFESFNIVLICPPGIARAKLSLNCLP